MYSYNGILLHVALSLIRTARLEVEDRRPVGSIALEDKEVEERWKKLNLLLALHSMTHISFIIPLALLCYLVLSRLIHIYTVHSNDSDDACDMIDTFGSTIQGARRARKGGMLDKGIAEENGWERGS